MTNSGATNVPASESGGNGTQPVAALNVYKKVAIIRGSEDVLTYEDPDGNVKTVTDLHLAAVESVSSVSSKRVDQCCLCFHLEIFSNVGFPFFFVKNL
jgi:hypothetical protein